MSLVWLTAVVLLLPLAEGKKVLDAKSVFKAIDSDADGKASHEELMGYLRENKAQGFQMRHDGVMDAQRRRIQSLVSQLDVDKDNHVSHDEFPGKAAFADKATFAEADENQQVGAMPKWGDDAGGKRKHDGADDSGDSKKAKA